MVVVSREAHGHSGAVPIKSLPVQSAASRPPGGGTGYLETTTDKDQFLTSAGKREERSDNNQDDNTDLGRRPLTRFGNTIQAAF